MEQTAQKDQQPIEDDNDDALLHTQRLAGIGTLTAGIAHELTNPINIITATCSNLLNQLEEGNLSDEELRHYAEMIEHSAWRCARLIRTLRQYTYMNGQEIVPCDLNQVVESALVLVAYEFERNYNITFERQLAKDLEPTLCDKYQLIQVLINLLINARDAIAADGGIVRISTGRAPDGASQYIMVTDDGSGIDDELMPRIFEPFITSKPAEEGTGLGLAIATEIVEHHGGHIEAKNNEEGGATFTVNLPLRVPEPAD